MLFARKTDQALIVASESTKSAGSAPQTVVRLLCLLFVCYSLTDLPLKAQRVLRDSTTVSPLSYEIDGESSYVGTGAAKSGSKNVGDISEISSSAGIVASWQVRDSTLLRFGIQWQRYSFDPDPGVPIPNILDGLNLVVGADYQISPAILLRVEALPGLYGSFKNISSKDFNVPFEIGASYFWSTDLVFLAGVLVDVNSDTPVFPAIGVHWKIASRWILEGIAPRPQLQYLLSDKVTLFAGADFRETTFRMDDHFGQSSGVPKLDSAILQYTEIRASAGLTWKVTKSLSVDIEGGCVPYRRFFYPRADNFKVLSEDVVPFARIGLSAKF
jgi:hypothetical protein